ncbi:MAG: M3 family metallopeptidase, partial [Candidatus Riflebacteria bacterium]
MNAQQMEMEKNALNDNPLMKRSGLPEFEEIQPSHVVPAMNATLDQIEAELCKIEKKIIPTWDGLCQPLEELDLHFEYTWGVINHLISVKNSDELRQAYQEILPKVVTFSLRMSQSKPIYEGLKKIKAGSEFAGFNEAKKRIIEKKLKSAEQAGVGLEGKEKERFNEIANRLSKLSTDFSNNVLDATKAFELIITDPKDTEGWPGNLKNLTSQSWAKEKGNKDAKPDPEKGPWRVTLDYPISGPFLQHCRNAELRRQVYHAQMTKASEGKLDNTPLIDEILKLRREEARILGYQTYAELSLSNKMAATVEAVRKMGDELAVAAMPFAGKEHEELKKIAAEMKHPGELKHWDMGFYAERLREKSFNYTDEMLRPYFPLPRVLDGLFSLAERLFSISIVQFKGQFPKWNEDVMFFEVRNETGQVIANFYLDPYSRPAEKRGGAWMNECFGRRMINNKVRT